MRSVTQEKDWTFSPRKVVPHNEDLCSKPPRGLKGEARKMGEQCLDYLSKETAACVCVAEAMVR